MCPVGPRRVSPLVPTIEVAICDLFSVHSLILFDEFALFLFTPNPSQYCRSSAVGHRLLIRRNAIVYTFGVRSADSSNHDTSYRPPRTLLSPLLLNTSRSLSIHQQSHSPTRNYNGDRRLAFQIDSSSDFSSNPRSLRCRQLASQGEIWNCDSTTQRRIIRHRAT